MWKSIAKQRRWVKKKGQSHDFDYIGCDGCEWNTKQHAQFYRLRFSRLERDQRKKIHFVTYQFFRLRLPPLLLLSFTRSQQCVSKVAKVEFQLKLQHTIFHLLSDRLKIDSLYIYGDFHFVCLDFGLAGRDHGLIVVVFHIVSRNHKFYNKTTCWNEIASDLLFIEDAEREEQKRRRRIAHRHTSSWSYLDNNIDWCWERENKANDEYFLREFFPVTFLGGAMRELNELLMEGNHLRL